MLLTDVTLADFAVLRHTVQQITQDHVPNLGIYSLLQVSLRRKWSVMRNGHMARHVVLDSTRTIGLRGNTSGSTTLSPVDHILGSAC